MLNQILQRVLGLCRTTCLVAEGTVPAFDVDLVLARWERTTRVFKAGPEFDGCLACAKSVKLFPQALLLLESEGMVDSRKTKPEEGWVPTTKGQHLRGRRARDTEPEVALRRAVHRLGYRFRLHRRVAPRCTADFVLPRYGVSVFVDGCFWHGCPDHSPKEFRGPNAVLWQQKIETNRARDQRNTAAATRAGWTVIRVWECEVRSNVVGAAERVAKAADRG